MSTNHSPVISDRNCDWFTVGGNPHSLGSVAHKHFVLHRENNIRGTEQKATLHYHTVLSHVLPFIKKLQLLAGWILQPTFHFHRRIQVDFFCVLCLQWDMSSINTDTSFLLHPIFPLSNNKTAHNSQNLVQTDQRMITWLQKRKPAWIKVIDNSCGSCWVHQRSQCDSSLHLCSETSCCLWSRVLCFNETKFTA